MKGKKSVVVIGLGVFGLDLVRKLKELNQQKVAFDLNITRMSFTV